MEFKQFSKPIQIRIILRFISIITNTAVMPFIVLYFASHIGSLYITLLVILIGAIGAMGSVLGGNFADSRGRKKIIILGESFTAVGFTLLLVGQFSDRYMIIISLFALAVTYFFTSFTLPAYSAFILDETTEETRKVVYVFMMWTSYLAFAIGSVLGGLLFAEYKILLFLAIILSSILNVMVIALFIPETLQKARKEAGMTGKSSDHNTPEQSLYQIVFQNKILLILLFVSFVFALMDNQLGYYLSLYYYELFGEKSYELLGFLRTENTIIAIVFLLVLKQFTTRFNPLNVAISGSILLFTGYVLLSSMQTEWWLYGAMLIASLGEILLFPSLQGLSAKYIPPMHRGRYASLANNLSTLGGVVSALFMIFHSLAHPNLVTVLFIMIGLGTVAALIKLRKILD